ncbi:MAG: preprotein translocase subunit YajC [FCB group bacterium]|nr:preprotein translocase subunit YajC [FCB group bacterium]
MGGIMGFLPWIMIILVFYFLLIRPQAKRQKQQQAMLAAVKKGDKIITSGGIHGTIVGVKENTNVLILKIADNMKIEIERSSVGKVLTASSEE